MSILSQENTDLLRNLLKDHPLQLADPRQFHEIFQNELERIHNARFNYKSNLMLMNKDILKTFLNIKNKMIQQQTSQQQTSQQQTSQQQTSQQQTSQQQTSQQQTSQQQTSQQQTSQQQTRHREIHQNKNENIKMQIFEKGLKEKQQDFNNLMNKEKPKEIDFSDKRRESSLSQSDYDHNMTQREAELAKIMQSQQQNKSVEAWLKGETNAKPSTINLKIDHTSNVKLDAIPLQKQKKVRFQETVTNDNHVPNNIQEPDFFSKLKLKRNSGSTQNNNYKSMFEQMIDNQKLILEQLVNISERLKPKTTSKTIKL